MSVWDPRRWQRRAVIRRIRLWINGTRRRRRAVWAIGAFLLLLVLPAVVGAVATAQWRAATVVDTPNSALAWMDVTDSHGIKLADYKFATDYGGLFDWGNAIVSVLLQIEFVGWVVVVTTAIWLIGYAISFQWLDLFSNVLSRVAASLTGQVATPIMLITAATIGAFFVAYFLARGLPSKATMQVVSMLGVAIFGAFYLSQPLSDVLSSDGWLAQGRNVGLSVAEGLTGWQETDHSKLITRMESDLAEGFARKPLQIWNFGHVVDRQGACGQAWSDGVASHYNDQLKESIRSCGDQAALYAAEHPSWGQLGTGLVLIICAGILLFFAVGLALRVIFAALDSIYHGFMAIFGFAAGGFVYGPTQTFLVRNIVDSLVAAASMAVYTVFLGVYVLVLLDLFQQANGNEMAIFVIGAVVELVAISQVRRLSDGLTETGAAIADRFSSVMAGAGGSGDGAVSGMGPGSVSHVSAIRRLEEMSIVNNNPLVQFAALRTLTPFSPYSIGNRRIMRQNVDMAKKNWQYNWQESLADSRIYFDLVAKNSLARFGYVGKGSKPASALQIARTVDDWIDMGMPEQFMLGSIMRESGASARSVMAARQAKALQEKYTPDGVKPVMRALTAWHNYESRDPTDPAVGTHLKRALLEQTDVSALQLERYAGRTAVPRKLTPDEQLAVDDLRDNWDSVENLTNAFDNAQKWNNLSPHVRNEVTRDVAKQLRDAISTYRKDQSPANLEEVQNVIGIVRNLHDAPAVFSARSFW